jgi:hypothetical protein
MRRPKSRLDWPAIVTAAADIVRSYDTLVTLRQLFYRLVAARILPNLTSSYKTLSERTAAARRAGLFPALIDRTRRIHRYQSFGGLAEATAWLSAIYRRDRTEGQPWNVYLGVEKNGIIEQLQAWFGDLGIPILALGGYASQTYVDEVAHDAARDGRPSALIYAGDFDPSGEDIDRDFAERAACFDEVVRVALTVEQVDGYKLPPNPGKDSDSRAGAFIARHGELLQVELDALPPETLRALYQAALNNYWDKSTYQATVHLEERERAKLRSRKGGER